MFGLPVAETFGRVVEAAGGADEILDRARGEQVAGRLPFVDAEIFRAADNAAVAQVIDHVLVAGEAHRRIAGDAANGLLALLVRTAEQQVGYALLGQMWLTSSP